MRHAFTHPIRVEPMDDGSGNLLEVGVIDGADGPWIDHGMPARERYL